MLLGPGHPFHAVLVLAGAAAFGVAIWTVTLRLLALRATLPAMPELLLLLIPAACATLALAFGTGLWFGRRHPAGAALRMRRLAMDGGLPAAKPAPPGAGCAALPPEEVAPGAALFDTQHRLLAWSRGFAALAEVPETALRPGMPLADLVRLQPPSQTRKLSRHGIESGIPGAARRQRGDGSQVEDRWAPAEKGGMLLTCRPARPPGQRMPLSATELAALCGEEVLSRLPRLQAAVAAGDAAAARMEAHALRGVAAGFGLEDLAEALLAVEQAARAGDLEQLTAASSALPQRAEEALRRLGGQPV